MLIQEMTKQECFDLLAQVRFGRLGCARDNQPYVMPVYFAYGGNYLYGIATVGQKIEWMRMNPLVCVEADEIVSQHQWTTVIVSGSYEEMPDVPEWERERARAHELLQQRAMWWQPAYVASTHRGVPHSLEPVCYRIRIDRISGHRATPDSVEVFQSLSTDSPATGVRGWLHRFTRRARINSGVKNS